MLSNRFISANAKKSAFLFITLFYLFCLLGFLNSALAKEQRDDEIEEKQYEVEIIVFTRTSDSETETWAENTEPPTITGSVELVNSFELLTDPEIDQLPFYYLEPNFASNDDFSTYVKRMSKNSKYNVLLHRIWHQTVDDNSSGLPVFIASKSDNLLYQRIEEPVKIVDELADRQRMNETLLQLGPENQLSMLDPIIPFDENPIIPESHPVDFSTMGPPEHKIYGTVRLSKSRFMHISLDFIYRDHEIITEHTIYPQLIQTEEPAVDNIDGVDNFLDTETVTENSFLLTPENHVENFPTNEAANQALKKNIEIETAEQLLRDEVGESDIRDESLKPELEILEHTIASEQNHAESFLTPEKPPFIGYRLQGSKRVRLSKVYYIDHPKFGIIARVIRYEPSKDMTNSAN